MVEIYSFFDGIYSIDASRAASQPRRGSPRTPRPFSREAGGGAGRERMPTGSSPCPEGDTVSCRARRGRSRRRPTARARSPGTVQSRGPGCTRGSRSRSCRSVSGTVCPGGATGRRETRRSRRRTSSCVPRKVATGRPRSTSAGPRHRRCTRDSVSSGAGGRCRHRSSSCRER